MLKIRGFQHTLYTSCVTLNNSCFTLSAATGKIHTRISDLQYLKLGIKKKTKVAQIMIPYIASVDHKD